MPPKAASSGAGNTEEGNEGDAEGAEVASRPKPTPEWMDEVLKAHNTRRLLHWTPPLVWSELCYEYAKRQADACADANKLSHGLTDCVQGRLGQCICGPPTGPFPKSRPGAAESCVNKWYSELSKYNFESPVHLKQCANFQQVIWFATTSVGMAISKCGRYAVANYYPAGPDSIWKMETPGEKGRRLYFPGGCNVDEMTANDKYHRWFKTNILPISDGPPPWLGGVAVEEPEEEEQLPADAPGPVATEKKAGKKNLSRSTSKKTFSPTRKALARTRSASPLKEGKMMAPSQMPDADRSPSPDGRRKVLTRSKTSKT